MSEQEMITKIDIDEKTTEMLIPLVEQLNRLQKQAQFIREQINVICSVIINTKGLKKDNYELSQDCKTITFKSKD